MRTWTLAVMTADMTDAEVRVMEDWHWRCAAGLDDDLRLQRFHLMFAASLTEQLRERERQLKSIEALT